MNKLKTLKEDIENIEITYDYEESYTNLYKTVIDYMNETQEWRFEYLFDRFISYEIAEEIAKRELEKGGLDRLKYYLGDTDFYMNDLFIIDAYGNLENVYKEDLEDLKDEILDAIKYELKEEIWIQESAF